MTGMDRPCTRSERAFAGLVALFPAGFRQRFGTDMRDLFRDQLRAAHAGAGLRGVARLWMRTFLPMARAALLEHRDAIRERRSRPSSHAERARRDGMPQTLVNDLRFAGRMLRKSPVFTAIAVLVVALGTGAVSTIFSAMNAVVLRPLPGASEGTRLVQVHRTREDRRGGLSASYSFYESLRERSRALDGVAAWGKIDLSISTGREGTVAYGNIVSGNYFSVLGVRPALGRFFLPDEDATPLTQPVLVVSHSYWQSHLGGDSSVVGRPVMVNGHPFTLIGVAPAEFRGVFTPIRTDAWVPLMMQGQLRPGVDLEHAPWLWVFGRLRDGVSRAAAHQELELLAKSWVATAAEPARFRDYAALRVSPLTGLPDDARAAFLGFTGLLMGAAALVLLIASVNVASMLSARAIARRREMAVRAALGASRGRLVRQLLTETLLLFLMGAIGGVLISVQATRALERIQMPTDVPIVLDLSPDLRVFGFALAVSLMTGLAFGLAPAFKAASRDVVNRLRDDSAGSGSRRGFTGNVLIVGQLAFSLVLLVSAGLFLRALERGQRIDVGFDATGVATAPLNTEAWGYDGPRGRAFYRLLRERLEAVPGVTSVTFASIVPLSMSSSGDDIRVDDADAGTGGRERIEHVLYNKVGADYFAVLRIPIVSGRPIEERDDDRSPRVAVVNETMARKLWVDRGAVGRTFEHRGERVTIVGVARDSRFTDLAESGRSFVYFPMEQGWEPGQALLLRTQADPAAMSPAITETIHAIDPLLPRSAVATLKQATGVALLPQRVAAMVTGVLGGIGLLLAAVGLYGIVSFSTNRRTREIGVRMALGARRKDVTAMIVRDGLRLTLGGVVLGLLLSAAAARLLERFLFSVSMLDAITFAGTSVVFVTVALFASWLPARRAAAADPTAALRADA